MNLFIFPEAATNKDGYGIAVDYAYRKLLPQKDDVVIWLSSYEKKDMLHLRDSDIIIRRKSLFSIHSIINLIRLRNRSELSVRDLEFIKDYEFEKIYCDEVIFYRSLRKLFPSKKIIVRFHNCFSRISVRNSFLKRNIGWKYEYGIYVMRKLEEDIFKDKNVTKIFLSNEDRDFYRSIYGIKSDSESWLFTPDINQMKKNQKELKLSHKLVWFGGIEAHKESSVRWFIDEVYICLKKEIPDLEFHLWGRNTKKFHNPHISVFGHGFFEGKGMPLSNGLYLNPDIIGGGVKLKLKTFLENGIPFVTTPFGFEGYEEKMKDDSYCIVAEESCWEMVIRETLKKFQ